MDLKEKKIAFYDTLGFFILAILWTIDTFFIFRKPSVETLLKITHSLCAFLNWLCAIQRAIRYKKNFLNKE